MGFYGNITNTNRTQFQFDKTYPNRKVMDDAARFDGIYIGRYVLVEYDTALAADWATIAYQKTDENGILRFYSTEDLNPNLEILYGDTNIHLNKYIRVPGIMTSPDGQIKIIHNLDDPTKIEDTLYLIGEGIKGYTPPVTIISSTSKDTYGENYNIDNTIYGVSRGYDSTVWQKVYADGTERYVMIAELNTVVPSFAVVADAPTLSPVAPHFDTESNNIYYKLHWQPSWGLRVKSASPDIVVRPINDLGQTITGEFVPMSDKLNNKLPSDETTIWTRSAYNSSTGEQKDFYLSPAINKETYKIIGEWEEAQGIVPEHAAIPAAIYYNKAGFDPAIITYSDTNVSDSINITPSGLSGQKYNTHENNGILRAQVDTQELSIMLPSIGNSVAKLWDIIYGSEEVNGSRNRNTYIEWSEGSLMPNTNGLRLVTTDVSGYNYNPNQVETLAGAINSVHDLMGMIIQSKEDLSLDNITSEMLSDWNQNYIYYLKSEGKFYKKHKTYQYTKENITNINKNDYFNSLEFSTWPEEGYYILDYSANNPLDNNGKILPNFIKEKEYNFDNTYYNNIIANYPIAEFTGGFFEPYKFFEYQAEYPLIDEKGNSIKVDAFQTSLDRVFDKNSTYLNITHEKLPDNTRFWTESGEYYTAEFTIKNNPTQSDLNDGILFIQDRNGRFYRPNTAILDESKTYYTPVSFAVQSSFDASKQYFTVSKKVQGNTVYIEQIQYLLAEDVTAENFNNNTYYYKINNEYYQADIYDSNITYYTKKSTLIQSEGQTQIAAKDIIEITLRDVNNPPQNGIYCYYHAKSHEGHDQYYALNKNNCSGLTSNLVVAYITEVANIYEPNLYYYQITDINNPYYGSYIFDSNDKPTDGRIYYSIENIKEENKLDFSVNPIYEPNKYYYKDNNNEYILSTSKILDNNKTYYKKNKLYVISDTSLICPIGMEWNMNVSNIPEGVELGTRQDVWELEELTGFARHFNTIHGLILNISNLLEPNNELIRNYDTVQGSLNKLKDIFAQFGELYPNRIAVTDKYGRLTTTTLIDDNWIYTHYNDKSNITINHQYIGESTGIGEHTVNGEATGRNLKFGEEFISPTFSFKTDDMGHVNAFTTSKVNLRIPTITYVDETQGNVIVNMEMAGKDTADITFTETRENVGNLTLADYKRTSDNEVTNIVATDTINIAFDKINTTFDNLDYSNGEDTKYVYAITQENGLVSVQTNDITNEIEYDAENYSIRDVTSPKAVHDYVVGVSDGLITTSTGGDETQYISYVKKENGQLQAKPKTITNSISPNEKEYSIIDVVSPKALHDYSASVTDNLNTSKTGVDGSQYISYIKKENDVIVAVPRDITNIINPNEEEYSNVDVTSPKAVHDYTVNVTNNLITSATGKDETQYISYIEKIDGKLQAHSKTIKPSIDPASTEQSIIDVVSPKAVYDYVSEVSNGLIDGGDTYYVSAIQKENGKLALVKKEISITINENSIDTAVVSPKAVYSFVKNTDSEIRKYIDDSLDTLDLNQVGKENGTYIAAMAQENGKIKPVVVNTVSEIINDANNLMAPSQYAVYKHVADAFGKASMDQVGNNNNTYITWIAQENGLVKAEFKTIAKEVYAKSSHDVPVSPLAVYNYVNSITNRLTPWTEEASKENTYLANLYVRDEKIEPDIRKIETQITDASAENTNLVSAGAVYKYLNEDYLITTDKIQNEAITNEKISVGLDSFKSIISDYSSIKNSKWYSIVGIISEEAFNNYKNSSITLYTAITSGENTTYIPTEIYSAETVYYKETGWNDNNINHTLMDSDSVTKAIVKLEYKINKALDTVGIQNLQKLEGDNVNANINISSDTLGQALAKLIYRVEQIEAKLNS